MVRSYWPGIVQKMAKGVRKVPHIHLITSGFRKVEVKRLGFSSTLERCLDKHLVKYV